MNINNKINNQNSLKTLDWSEILLRMSQSATSEVAKQKILELSPKKNPEDALTQVEQIFHASEVLSLGVRPFMSSLDLFSTWIQRLQKKSLLKILEIRDVRHFCLEALALKETLAKVRNSWTLATVQMIMEAERPISAIDQVLTPSGEIRSDASEKLFRLTNERDRLAQDVQNHLDRLVRDHQMENLLQEKFVTTRDGRWVLPIKSGMQHFMPGVIHGSSQTKQTVFMEPDKIIPLNNRLRQIEVEIEDEIERILTELSYFLSSLQDDFLTTREILDFCDQILALAQFSAQISASAFLFSEKNINLKEIKHPLLLIQGKNVVANTVELNENKSVLLLSGPNAGGKTVLLKSIGLAAQMARCGLPICAQPHSEIPFFDNILVGLGDSQNVGEDLSTFAAHLKILQKSSELKGQQQLILIDEICGSTDPEEGSALARSFIERFCENQVFAVITSHLSPLKTGWKEQDRVLSGSLEYDSKTGRPTYQFLSGISGDSLALQTAQRVGVEKSLLDRAYELLSPATRERLKALDDLEKLKLDIHNLQNQWRKEHQKAQDLKIKYEKMIQEFQKEKEDSLRKTLKKAERQVDEAIAQAKVDDTFKKHRQLQEIKYQLPEIVKARSIVATGVPETAEEFAKKFPPGTKIFIPNLGQDGVIQSTPNAKGEVLVLSQSIRLQLNWKDLKPPTQASNPTGHIIRQSSHFSAALITEDRTLDLRGKTVEEALEELEVSLDRAHQNQEDRIKVIHGHGTEALKKAVRTFLSRSIYVKKWKSGGIESGGDGVTWAELNKD